MFFELIATITIGVGAAGVAMLARRLSGRRLPGWVTPVTAGAAMIGFVLWAEYSWYGRTVAALPDGVEVATANESRQVYRPWTYVAPLTDRLMEEGRFSARLFAKARPRADLGATHPEDLAALALFLASPEAALITGQAISVNGGISAA